MAQGALFGSESVATTTQIDAFALHVFRHPIARVCGGGGGDYDCDCDPAHGYDDGGCHRNYHLAYRFAAVREMQYRAGAVNP